MILYCIIFLIPKPIVLSRIIRKSADTHLPHRFYFGKPLRFLTAQMPNTRRAGSEIEPSMGKLRVPSFGPRAKRGYFEGKN